MPATMLTLDEVRDHLGWTLSAGEANGYGQDALPEPDAADPVSGAPLWNKDTIDAAKLPHDHWAIKWKARFDDAAAWWAEHKTWEGAPEPTRSWANRTLAPEALEAAPPLRRKLLEDSGMPRPSRGSGKRAAAWEQFVDVLDAWIEEHETAQVPQAATVLLTDGSQYPLGRRVSAARDRYYKGTLPQNRVKYLESLPGWQWEANIHEGPWETKMRTIEEIASREDWNGRIGSLQPALRTWLRRQFNARDRLPREKVRRLNALQKRLAPSPVDEFVHAVGVWLRRNEGLTPKDMVVRAEVPLPGGEMYLVGKRANYYQRRYAGVEKRTGGEPLAPLSAEDIAKIESIPGWEWHSPKVP